MTTSKSHKSSRIPVSYGQAEWRCTLPADKGEMGIAFNLRDGSIMRLRLKTESAKCLAETVLDYLHCGNRVQSDRSAEIPSKLVSST